MKSVVADEKKAGLKLNYTYLEKSEPIAKELVESSGLPRMIPHIWVYQYQDEEFSLLYEQVGASDITPMLRKYSL